jgi:catechol 2,3-dioxygenase-like lactoylglutathione lyase family enzyme
VTSLFHHVAIAVADLEDAIRFYGDALDATILTAPREVGPPRAAQVMGGPADGRFRACRLGFDAGCLELFQFLGSTEQMPDWAAREHTARVPHFGVEVADVAATLERVERAGGRRLWPHPEHWGSARTLYVADPDGNVFELCDTSLEALVEILLGLYRQADRARV